MGNFCFFIEKAQNLGGHFVEITGLVKDGTIKVGDIVKYRDIFDLYRWQIKSISKGKFLYGEASAEDCVVLRFSIDVLNDVTHLDSMQQQILVGENYDKPFISNEFVVSCENISVSVLKSARITFETDKLKNRGMILSVEEKNGKCYADVELLRPTYAKPGTKCVLVGDGWQCNALIEQG